MARIIAGVGCSHVPAIGAALDLGKTEEPYWKRVFAGFEKSKQWIADIRPDVAIVQRSRDQLFRGSYSDVRAWMRGPL
jgi:protocatechuate 4,5-dioxygenase, beta chain